MNMVAGATGLLGMEICRPLAAAGRPVRGLVRRTSGPAKRTVLEQLGVEIVEGDLQDPVSLGAACDDIEAVINTVTTTISRQPHDSIRATDLEGHKALISMARRAGVRHFVYISVNSALPAVGELLEAKRTVEAFLRASGMIYTILCPGPFMEVWLGPFGGFDFAGGWVRVAASGEGKQSWIALADVARCAVASLDTPAARDTTIDLGGPDWLSPNEVIRLAENLSGRRFSVEHLPLAVLQDQLASAADEYERTAVGLALFLAEGERSPFDIQPVLNVFPEPLTPVRAYVRQALAIPDARQAVPL
jgi:uncharacterized protein YbjT (DUF2867 family)